MPLKKICAFIIFAPLAVALVAFIIANRSLVTLNLDIFSAFSGRGQAGRQITAPLFVWLFGALIIGIALGALSMLPKLCRARRQRHSLEAENSRLLKELPAKKTHGAKDSLENISL